MVRKVKKGEDNLTMVQAQKNYKRAIDNGLLKILSKMGISLLSSYQGAQIFEILGLSQSVVDLAFKGTASQVGGLTMSDLEREMTTFKDQAYDETLNKLINAGEGEENQEAMPEVSPPNFIEVTKSMIENFGNLAVPGQEQALKVRN